MDDDELERLLRYFKGLMDRCMAEEAREILDRLDEHEPVDVDAAQVVLLGFEGNVDGVYTVPVQRRLDVLYRPIPVNLAKIDLDDPVRRAEYRRIGEGTYQRER